MPRTKKRAVTAPEQVLEPVALERGIPLEELARQINAAHSACEQAMTTGMQHALTAGSLLLQAKVECPHGTWTTWLSENCQFSERTAQAYMRVAKELPEANPQRVALLSFRQVLKELARPDDSSLPQLVAPGGETPPSANGVIEGEVVDNLLEREPQSPSNRLVLHLISGKRWELLAAREGGERTVLATVAEELGDEIAHEVARIISAKLGLGEPFQEE